jgi:hypothetical protein
MDIPAIAQAATAALAPFLPYLLKLGDKAAEEGAKKIGADAWEVAKKLWVKISPTLKEHPAANEAISDVASMPDDPDTQAVLRVQFRKLLSRDIKLATEIERFLAELPRSGTNVIVAGERAVGIGGDVTHSTIITGDSGDRRQQKT